jgi:ureidoacrylate peracid hydrolase
MTSLPWEMGSALRAHSLEKLLHDVKISGAMRLERAHEEMLQPTPLQKEKAVGTNKTALVLIEYQNDFTSPGGTLHDAVKGVMEKTGMLANTIETVKKARALGATIVFVPITFVEGYGEMRSEPYGILKGVKDSKSFVKGSWGAEIVESLKPQVGDIVIEGKRGLCGFESTNLDWVLRSRGITDIALAGFLTNCCVESTMRVGYEKGFNVVTLTDCTAALSQEEQDHACAKNFPMFSRPLTHTEWLNELSGLQKASDKTRGYEAAQ